MLNEKHCFLSSCILKAKTWILGKSLLPKQACVIFTYAISLCVCGYFLLWRPEPRCKERQQRLLMHCATFPEGASREHSERNPMGDPGWEKAKGCFISALGKSNLWKHECHHLLAVCNVPSRLERQEKSFKRNAPFQRLVRYKLFSCKEHYFMAIRQHMQSHPRLLILL